MIISASRRTDIPAFYTEWFINRVRASYCTVPNPFNRRQVAYVSLRPGDVELIVFWTRNPKPLFPHLEELSQRGFRYYFQFTLMDNPRVIEPKSPPLEAAIATFRELSGLIGPAKVIWRYDPILFSAQSDAQFHQDTFGRIARALNGCTQRVVISIADVYFWASKRLRDLETQGIRVVDYPDPASPSFGELMRALVSIAGENGMEIVSCAETIDLRRYGIAAGKCIDDDYIARNFGIHVTSRKDPFQRDVCGCVISKDIGAYDTCLFGCQYCYATTSFERARKNYEKHDPNSPSLVGWYDVGD